MSVITVNEIDALEQDFLTGRIEALRGRPCPVYGGHLLYTVAKGEVIPGAPTGRRYRCGMSIYCLGSCNTMLTHLDGFCPSWAEDISDWREFSMKLYEQETSLR